MGRRCLAAAQAYAAEKAPQAKSGKYWERQTATFSELWDKFSAHELASPDLRPSTVADYKALGRLYLVPHLGALRRAGLPPLRFHDLRHMAGTLMHEAGVPLKRAQEILGHASERTTLAIYTHSMRRTRDDSADKIAELAGVSNVGNKWETIDPAEPSETELSDCLIGSPGCSVGGTPTSLTLELFCAAGFLRTPVRDARTAGWDDLARDCLGSDEHRGS